MKTRILSCLLAVLLLAGIVPTASAATYSDVPERHWAAASIEKATEAGLFQGVDATTFGLGQTITRAQFAIALGRLFGWEPVTPETPSFTDCAPNRWFYTAIETAQANGAIHSYETEFRPGDPITREELAVQLVRSLGYASLAARLSEDEIPFADVTTNRGYIAAAYELGLINGVTATEFCPDAPATREQAATVIVRLWEKLSAESVAVTEKDGYTLLTIPCPEATKDTATPTTPLESFVDLYDALKARRDAGEDMSKLALVLTDGGVATLVQGRRITFSEQVFGEELAEYLAHEKARFFYSQRHECAYLIAPYVGSGTVTVWYQTEESMQAKLQLCRLFGVNAYLLQGDD